jgi:glycosyltransferase involved in cell wall biosynthesis
MNGKLRVLHIGNGKAFKIQAIANAFVERGHDVHMLPIPPVDGEWPGVTWHRLPAQRVPGKASVIARFFQVRHLTRRLAPDVVHAHNAWGPGWYAAALRRYPLVIQAYGGDLLPEQHVGRPRFQRLLTRWTCRTADRVVVTAPHMVAATARLGVPRHKIAVLSRGVDLERYRPGLDTGDLRSRLRLTPSSRVVLSPRYQIDESLYNLDIILDAFDLVRTRFPTAVCVQLFDPAREHGHRCLADVIASRGLQDHYRLVPTVDNTTMPLFYNLADVVVSVPSSDGFPVTVLEASACAAPVVVSDLAYCAEWFAHGRNGLVVPVRDVKALADAIVDVLSDPGRGRRFGAAARRLVESRADYRQCMADLERLYHEVLAARKDA